MISNKPLTKEERERIKPLCKEFWEHMRKTNQSFNEQRRKYAGSSFDCINIEGLDIEEMKGGNEENGS